MKCRKTVCKKKTGLFEVFAFKLINVVFPLAICILPCLNGGRCSAPYKCSCPDGYEGVRCQTGKDCRNTLWPVRTCTYTK